MRTLRIWVLVLLAVLLPVRGAIAAAMLCLPATGGGQSTVAAATGAAETGHHAPGATDHQHEHADHQHSGSEVGKAGASGYHSDGVGDCNLCCDYCSMTPLLSTLPSVPAPLDLSSVSFPDPFAPAPSFLSDGQERPPRSI